MISRSLKFGAAAALATVAVATVSTTTAHAQSIDEVVPTQKKFRVKVGGYFPQASAQQDALGQNFISFGLGYDIAKTTSATPVVYEIYADYLERTKKTTDFGRTEFETFGLGLAARYLFTDANKKYRPYAGAGVGLYFNRLKIDQPDGDFSNRHVTGLGGKFLLGTEMNNGIFGELEYNFLPRPKAFSNKVNLDGFQFRIGYRFF